MAEDLSKYPWKKKRSYVGLDTKRANIVDTSELSPDYFAIQDLPKTLSAGKNSLLVQGTSNLLPSSEIKVEILDQFRNPLYWEITDWVDFAQRRAIVIYVYPETAPGPATITICGMTQAGHVRWTANVNIDPNVPNSTPILFSERPTILIDEVFKPMYKPSWTGDKIASQSVDDNHTRISYQYSGKRGYENYSGSLSDNLDTSNNAKKLYKDNTESKTIWTTWNTDAITSPKGYKGFSNYSREIPSFKNTTFKQDKSEISTQQGVTLVLSQSSTPAFEFTKEHEGGTLNIDSFTGISATYTTKITKVINKNTVLITDKLLDSNGNSVRSAEDGTFSVTHSVSPDSYSGSQAYENFASFKLHDINPMTGDIYRVKVWARQHDSTNNEFELVANKILESTNIFIDKNVPPFDKPLGSFVTGSIVETYWSASSHTNIRPRSQYGNQIPTGVNIASASWDNSNISEALKLNTVGGSPLTVGYAKLLPISGGNDIFNIDVYNNCRYGINISALYASVSSSYSGSKFHIGVSGSSIDSTPINQDMKYLFTSTGFEGRILDTFSPDDITRKSGTYSYNLDNLNITFSPNQSGSVTPVIIVEGGEWSFSELSIESQEEIGYNPSYAEIEVPIAPKFDGSNLDFKFEYTDYLGNSSKDVTYINNVPFASGKQTFIQGDKNIVTGSMWIGDTISSGIEMKGVEGGAFIRTAGYGGFNAATGSGSPGFMVYSGSFSLTEDGVTTSYSGMGLELASGSSSSLRFSTDPSIPGLVIDANSLTVTQITMSGGGTGTADITASWAINAISASYALSASHEIVYETSSSYADFAASGDGPFSGSFTGSFTGDGSALTGIAGGLWTGSSNSITRDSDVQITGSLKVSGSLIELYSPSGSDAIFHIRCSGSGDAILKLEADLGNAGTPGESDNPRIEFVQDGAMTQSAIYQGNNTLNIANSVVYGGIDFLTGTVNGYTNATSSLFIGSTGNITASGNYSSSIVSTASFGTYTGDGSQLTGISGGGGSGLWSGSAANMYTGDGTSVYVSGSQTISSSFTGGDTNSTVLKIIGSGSVSGSAIFEVAGTPGSLFLVTDGLDGQLFAANDASGLSVISAYADRTVKLGKPGGFGIVISGSNPMPSDADAKIFITGSTYFSGSVADFSQVGTITGITATSASYASTATSASYAITASYALNAGGGGGGAGLWSGSAADMYTGDGTLVYVSGSQIISQSFTSGDTDSTALKIIGSGSVSGSAIFEVAGTPGSLFLVTDGLDGQLFAANDASGLSVISAFADRTVKLGKPGGFGIVISGSNPMPNDADAKIFITGSTYFSGSVADFSQVGEISGSTFSGSFSGDGSGLTGIAAGATTLDGLTDVKTTSDNSIWIMNAGAGSACTTGTLSTALENIGIGTNALNSITSGDYNIAIGLNSGTALLGALHNVMIGRGSGAKITSGESNVCIGGYDTGGEITTESNNVLLGYQAGGALTSAANTIIGHLAGTGAMTAGFNTFVGNAAGTTTTGGGQQNYAFGYSALAGTSGNYNICIGRGTAGSTGAGNISIGQNHSGNQYLTGNYSIKLGYLIPASATNASSEFILGGNNILLMNGTYATSGRAKLLINPGATVVAPTANLNVKGHASDSTTFLVEDGSGDSILQVNQDGNVGIGTSDPNYNLHLSQSGDINVKIQSNNGFARLLLDSANNDVAVLQFNENVANRWQIAVDGTNDSLVFTRSDITAGSITPALTIRSSSVGSSDSSAFGGNVEVTGSLLVSSSFTSGDTTSNTLKVMGSGSVSGSGLFEVIGDAGTLFSVADGLSGSLMAVTDESGIPVLEVFSDHTITAEGFRGWRPIQTQGSDFTLQLADSGYYHRVGGNVTCSLSASAGIPFPIGTEIEFIQTSSAGNVYITASNGSGITLNSKGDNLKLAGQWSAATIKKVALNEWDIIGDLT